MQFAYFLLSNFEVFFSQCELSESLQRNFLAAVKHNGHIFQRCVRYEAVFLLDQIQKGFSQQFLTWLPTHKQEFTALKKQLDVFCFFPGGSKHDPLSYTTPGPDLLY